MGARGRKPAPSALKIARGVHPFRLNPNEPQFPAGDPVVPELVRGDPIAVKEWERFLPLLREAGVISQVDGQALGLYCLAFSTHDAAVRHIREHGYTVEGSQGQPKISPYFLILSDAEKRMRRGLADFGATPSSRSSIKTANPPDDLALFIGKSKGTTRRQ